jgi:hypothetical protein
MMNRVDSLREGSNGAPRQQGSADLLPMEMHCVLKKSNQQAGECGEGLEESQELRMDGRGFFRAVNFRRPQRASVA